MNAKKIMGAVLVALLAAALFVGAGAAGTLNDLDGKTVYVYQNMSNYPVANTVWYNTAGESVTFNAQGVIEQKDVKEGKYSYNDTISITVTKPTVKITATGVNVDKTYPVTGGNFYYGNGVYLTFNIISPAGGNITDILVTLPSGEEKKLTEMLDTYLWSDSTLSSLQSSLGNITTLSQIPQLSNLPNGNASVTLKQTSANDQLVFNALFGPVNNAKTGLYKFQGVFSNDGTAGNLTAVTPENLLIGQDVLSFKVVLSTETSISASVDTVVDGSTVVVTMTGVPGKSYNLTTDGYFEPIATGLTAFTLWNTGDYSFEMPNTGEIQITLKAVKVGDATLTLVDESDEKTVEIEVVEGTITAEADAESYFIGNDVKITGTSTSDAEVHFYIAGTNIGFLPLPDAGNNTVAVDDGKFEFKILGGVFKKYDAGTYTVYVASNDGAQNVSALDTYATVSLILKQPFVSVTEAPSVAVKGTDYVVKGTAEAAKDVYAYIFGTNYFEAATSGSGYSTTNDIEVTVKDNAFTIKVKADETEDMDAGQYFMVVQHPMYDTVFNVAPFAGDFIRMNSDGAAASGSPVVVDVFGRQKANAAEALCENLDSENIDDMYVKLSFVVAGPQSIINPIPEQIAQGEKLTISGSTNVGKGKIVTVEMLSTAFAAVPKATVGSASFISLVTKTDENGNWEITFDTSGLNVDEYTVTAAVESLDATTAKVNVVEAAPEQPDQPDVPGDEPEQPGDEPVAPETPGFGALAALAGLGAVAVLLLRRE